MNWQKTQSPWLKILAVFRADEPMSSVSAQKQSPWVETVSPRAHEFRHNHKKGPQKTPKFMGSLPHDRAHITCWLGSGWWRMTRRSGGHFGRATHIDPLPTTSMRMKMRLTSTTFKSQSENLRMSLESHLKTGFWKWMCWLLKDNDTEL